MPNKATKRYIYQFEGGDIRRLSAEEVAAIDPEELEDIPILINIWENLMRLHRELRIGRPR